MAVVIKGLSGLQWGIETAETGINAESFEVRYYPAVNEKLNGITGEPVARGQSEHCSRELTVNGEVTGSTGIMAAVPGTAIVPANDVDTVAGAAGGFYFDELTESQSRNGWRTASLRASSDPLIS